MHQYNPKHEGVCHIDWLQYAKIGHLYEQCVMRENDVRHAQISQNSLNDCLMNDATSLKVWVLVVPARQNAICPQRWHLPETT